MSRIAVAVVSGGRLSMACCAHLRPVSRKKQTGALRGAGRLFASEMACYVPGQDSFTSRLRIDVKDSVIRVTYCVDRQTRRFLGISHNVHGNAKAFAL